LIDPSVEMGTERGGEDLNLVYTCHHDGEQPPVDEPIEPALAAADFFDGCNVTCSDDSEEEYVPPGVHVHYRTCHYDFEWEGDANDAMTHRVYQGKQDEHGVFVSGDYCSVEEYFRNPDNWRFCHKPGQPPKLVCTTDTLIAGNAE